MSAKKSDFGLIIKLLVALAIGAFLGRMANVEVMDAVASVKYALGQIIFYAVPLVIVGFITPAIARLGQNASKMLLTAVAIAYLSSVGAAAFSAVRNLTDAVPSGLRMTVANAQPWTSCGMTARL